MALPITPVPTKPVVDETALARALHEGVIAGAAIDVYEVEPLPPDSPLRQAPNLVLTPHLGASTREAQVRAGLTAEMKREMSGELITSDTIHYSWYIPFGLTTPAGWVAMFAQRYLHTYGATGEDLGRDLEKVCLDVDQPIAALMRDLKQVKPLKVSGAVLNLPLLGGVVLAVALLDGRPVGSGKPGPVFRAVHQAYQDFKRSTMRRAA